MAWSIVKEVVAFLTEHDAVDRIIIHWKLESNMAYLGMVRSFSYRGKMVKIYEKKTSFPVKSGRPISADIAESS